MRNKAIEKNLRKVLLENGAFAGALPEKLFPTFLPTPAKGTCFLRKCCVI